jgi:hypothetical protein
VSQRNSEYARIEGDTYVTPKWVYEALYTVEPWAKDAWDCAPALSAMTGYNYLEDTNVAGNIATNPPFNLSDEFVIHSLSQESRPKVAMLLPHAWDTAKTRRELFEHGPYKAKYTLTKRIRWENLEQKKNGPSTNHAWYVWDWSYDGKPFMGWLP